MRARFPLKNSSKCIFIAENTSGGIFDKEPISAGVAPGEDPSSRSIDIPLTYDFSGEHTSHHGSARQAIASDHEEIFSPASIGDRAYGSIGVKASRLPDRVLKILRKIFLGVPKDLDDGLTVREG
jgi:hypothetical protein